LAEPEHLMGGLLQSVDRPPVLSGQAHSRIMASVMSPRYPVSSRSRRGRLSDCAFRLA
jgi:hypothetical protein